MVGSSDNIVQTATKLTGNDIKYCAFCYDQMKMMSIVLENLVENPWPTLLL